MNMHKAAIAYVCLFVLFCLAGCTWFDSNLDKNNDKPNTPSLNMPQQNVGDATKTVGEVAVDIGKRADTIDTHTDQITVKSSQDQNEKIKTEIDGIKTETKGLKDDQYKLIGTEQKLKETQTLLNEQQKLIEQYTSYTKQSEKQITDLQEKVRKLQEENDKMLKTMMSWISVACVVGIGACLAIGFFLKTPTAFIIAGGCIITLGVSVAVTLYMQYIAWVALAVLGVGCVGTIIYVTMQIYYKDKAVDELVHTGEIAKTYLDGKARQKIFGTQVEPGVAHLIQSNVTKNLVKKSRVRAKTNKIFGLAPEIAATK